MRTLTLSIVAILAILGVACKSDKRDSDSANFYWKGLDDPGISSYKRGHYQAAMHEFEPRAKNGDPIAQLYVGLMYRGGQGVKKDQTQAQNWYKKAANQFESGAMRGDRVAQLYMGYMYDLGLGKKKDQTQAKYWYEKAANQRLPRAQFKLGEMYEKGEGVKANRDSAKHWYEKAANQDLTEAQYRLGVMYHDGDVAKAKPDTAKHWYEKAAKKGHVEAQYKFSMLYFEILKEQLNSLQDSLKAVDGDDSDSMNFMDYLNRLKVLTNLYLSSIEKKENLGDLAEDWLQKAIKQESAKAYYQYGVRLQYHYGNFKEAAAWYEKAAKKGLKIAQNELATMYYNCSQFVSVSSASDIPEKYKMYYESCKQLGDDSKKKSEKIARLYLEAAQRAYTLSQLNLGHQFEIGLENDEGKVLIKKNYEEAYYWYRLAQSTQEKSGREEVTEKILVKDEKREQELKEKINEAVRRTREHLKDEKKTKIDSLVNSWIPKEQLGNGTGFYISNKYILTNAHVVCSNYPSYPCIPYHELRIPFQRVEFVESDKEVDLALLHVEPSIDEDHVAKLRDTTKIQLGEKVAVFGYPISHYLSYLGNFTDGVVSGLVGMIDDPQVYNLFQYTAPIQRGNSGGPVFDYGGNVIGVAVGTLEPQIYWKTDEGREKIWNVQNINFAINLKTIKEFLKKIAADSTTLDPRLTKVRAADSTTLDPCLTWVEIAKQAQKFTVPVVSFKKIEKEKSEKEKLEELLRLTRERLE